MRRLNVDDLTPHARRILEETYAEADRRARCSRDDFYSGWIAALVHYRITSLFTTETMAEVSAEDGQ